MNRSLKEVRGKAHRNLGVRVIGGEGANAKALPRPEVCLTGRPVWLKHWKLARQQEALRSEG